MKHRNIFVLDVRHHLSLRRNYQKVSWKYEQGAQKKKMFSLGIIMWESSALVYPDELTDEKKIDDGTLKYSIIKGHGKRKVRKS